MTKHRSASSQHKSGSGFKGIKMKRKETGKEALPAKAIAIITIFLLLILIIVYYLNR